MAYKDRSSSLVVYAERVSGSFGVSELRGGEILGIINEVEQIICEGDCSKVPSLTQPQADAIKFRNDIEAALEGES